MSEEITPELLMHDLLLIEEKLGFIPVWLQPLVEERNRLLIENAEIKRKAIELVEVHAKLVELVRKQKVENDIITKKLTLQKVPIYTLQVTGN